MALAMLTDASSAQEFFSQTCGGLSANLISAVGSENPAPGGTSAQVSFTCNDANNTRYALTGASQTSGGLIASDFQLFTYADDTADAELLRVTPPQGNPITVPANIAWLNSNLTLDNSRRLITSGTISATAAGNTIGLNVARGVATFTGQTCAGNGTLALTINSTAVGSVGIVNFTCSLAPATAVGLYIQSAVWTAGTSLVVTICNCTANSTGAVNWGIAFESFN